MKALGGFFAIMNPFVTLPMFLSLTGSDDPSHQRRIGVRVVLYSAAMSLVVMVSGSAIPGFFCVSVSHFRVAGGIVLMTIGLGMLNGGWFGARGERAREGPDADPYACAGVRPTPRRTSRSIR